MEHKLTCDCVDLIFTGYWDEDHFECESVRLADPDAVMEDDDFLSEIDHEVRQERAESAYDHAEILIRGLQEWKAS